MSQVLRQSTQRVVRVGPFVDSLDGVTPETGVTLGAADQAEALKAAGAATADISGNTFAAIANCGGWYDLTLSTTDTNTVGDLTIVIQDSSVCLAVFAEFTVIEEEPYDDLYTANAVGYLKPTTAGRDLDVSAGGEAGVDWANVGSPTTTNALTGTTIATTQKVDIETIKTNAVVNGGTVTFPTTATLASTTNITAGTITTVTNLTNAPTAGDLTTAMKASVNAEVVDGLNVDTYAEPSAVPAATASIQAKVAWIAAKARNKITETSTAQVVRNDGDSGTIGTSTVSDDGTTGTRGKYA